MPCEVRGCVTRPRLRPAPAEARSNGSLRVSLGTMTADRPGRYGAVETLVCGIPCEGVPVCALTAMVFKEEP